MIQIRFYELVAHIALVVSNMFWTIGYYSQYLLYIVITPKVWFYNTEIQHDLKFLDVEYFMSSHFI